LASENVRHTVGKVSTRPTTLLQTATQSEVCSESYKASKLRESKVARFRDSGVGVPGVPREKSHLDAGSAASCRVYYKEGSSWLPQGAKVLASPPKGSEVVAHSQVRVWCVKVSPSSPVAVPTQKGSRMSTKGSKMMAYSQGPGRGSS
jgi:hypothetical protein